MPEEGRRGGGEGGIVHVKRRESLLTETSAIFGDNELWIQSIVFVVVVVFFFI